MLSRCDQLALLDLRGVPALTHLDVSYTGLATDDLITQLFTHPIRLTLKRLVMTHTRDFYTIHDDVTYPPLAPTQDRQGGGIGDSGPVVGDAKASLLLLPVLEHVNLDSSVTSRHNIAALVASAPLLSWLSIKGCIDVDDDEALEQQQQRGENGAARRGLSLFGLEAHTGLTHFDMGDNRFGLPSAEATDAVVCAAVSASCKSIRSLHLRFSFASRLFSDHLTLPLPGLAGRSRSNSPTRVLSSSLTCLDCQHSSLVDEGVASIASACPLLQRLDVSNCKRLRHVSVGTRSCPLKHLQTLLARGCSQLTTLHLACRGLAVVDLSACTLLEDITAEQAYPPGHLQISLDRPVAVRVTSNPVSEAV